MCCDLFLSEFGSDSNGFGKMPDNIPKFGTSYNFHLNGVVDCPEFLVNFDTLLDIAERHNLMLVAKQGFENYFKGKRRKITENGKSLFQRMQVM